MAPPLPTGKELPDPGLLSQDGCRSLLDGLAMPILTPLQCHVPADRLFKIEIRSCLCQLNSACTATLVDLEALCEPTPPTNRPLASCPTPPVLSSPCPRPSAILASSRTCFSRQPCSLLAQGLCTRFSLRLEHDSIFFLLASRYYFKSASLSGMQARGGPSCACHVSQSHLCCLPDAAHERMANKDNPRY